MRHVWQEKEWSGLRLDQVREALAERSQSSPKLGELTVKELCCLAKSPCVPVGIYIFTEGDEVLYTGKTHGRSFQERMVSHLDHREPIPGSPHLAQFAQSLVKKKRVKTSDEAVERILEMNITWLPIGKRQLKKKAHQLLIAHTERRLLWQGCLDPSYNSPRVKRNDSFTLKGVRYYLAPENLLGSQIISV